MVIKYVWLTYDPNHIINYNAQCHATCPEWVLGSKIAYLNANGCKGFRLKC